MMKTLILLFVNIGHFRSWKSLLRYKAFTLGVYEAASISCSHKSCAPFDTLPNMKF